MLRMGIVAILCLGIFPSAKGQDDLQTFRNFQFSFNRVSQAWMKNNDSLRSAFLQKGLQYPSRDILFRSFKSQNEMELWARDSDTARYTLVKTYRICALSGILGPKRYEGDLQVPEGFYFIDDFNPKSEFHLSMLINYPNYSDRILGDKERPGGDIYIHGGCSTVGCMPMTDPVIQELYTLCLNAKINGQSFIPVHIFPTRFTRASVRYLERTYAGAESKLRFWENLRIGFDYFERHHRPLPVVYTPEGEYVFVFDQETP